MKKIEILMANWKNDNVLNPYPATDEDILSFQQAHGVGLPDDCVQFFKTANGTGDEYDSKLFQFYALNKITTIIDEYSEWKGVPNYRQISETLTNVSSYYAFANYLSHSFAYVIRLLPDYKERGEVLAVSGGEFKMIAGSITEFIELYLNDSPKLQLG